MRNFNDLYSSSRIVWGIRSRRMRWAVHITHMEARRGLCRVVVGKPEGKKPLEGARIRREDNIKMDLKKWNAEA